MQNSTDTQENPNLTVYRFMWMAVTLKDVNHGLSY